MVKSGYKLISETFQDHENTYNSENWTRLIAFRRGPTTVRLEHPTNIARARALGYRAKQGYVVAMTRIRRGTMNKIRAKMGRKPSNLGINKVTTKKSLRWMAEERTAKKYPNLEVLNSYKIGSDGTHHYFEIILVDPSHPVILADPKINWIADSANHSRVYRGLTSAGRKTRSLRNRGHGAEHVRPSLRANKNLH